MASSLESSVSVPHIPRAMATVYESRSHLFRDDAQVLFLLLVFSECCNSAFNFLSLFSNHIRAVCLFPPSTAFLLSKISSHRSNLRLETRSLIDDQLI